MGVQQLSLALLLVLLSVLSVRSDTPANCTYDDVQGLWEITESQFQDDCSKSGEVLNTFRVELLFPNVATDGNGNRGEWTIIYNQGFEITINYRKFFAFSAYKDDGTGNVTSFCDRTLPGWSHDILEHNWACYSAKKVGGSIPAPKTHFQRQLLNGDHLHQTNANFISNLNIMQTSWTAKNYPHLDQLTLADHVRMKGGLRSGIHGKSFDRLVFSRIPLPIPVDAETKQAAIELPLEWDWRNVAGINYVNPVRNQGSCGSCFAFSAMGMLESRLRVATNNTIQVVLSPQDVVSCSKYAQGCEGGFPYLIGGKYAQDFGVVAEDCNPYKGQDGPCQEQKDCKRYYVAHYGYVGGFYGGCNEELMRLELVHQGPMSVSFEVYDDFMQYSGGVYHHTGLNVGFNPFAITNHAVLLVGYGTDRQTSEKYWLVKNSWGTEWGEQGYFRIRRGTNECNIESIAVKATPIPW